MTRFSKNGVVLLQVTNDQRGAAEPLTVYFDGSCALCSLEITHYASKADHSRVMFVDVSDSQSSTDIGVSLNELMRRFHVRLADGKIVSGARAFVAIWNELPNWKWLGKIAQFPGALFIVEFFYLSFLRIRPTLSRFVSFLGVKPLNSQQYKR